SLDASEWLDGEWLQLVDELGGEVIQLDSCNVTRDGRLAEMIGTVRERMAERYASLEKHAPDLREDLSPIVLYIDEGEEIAGRS
ncbi:hypothetical protein, partial [Microbacterium oxydans]